MRIVMFLVSNPDVPGVKVINHKTIKGECDEWVRVLQRETKDCDVAFIQYQREGQIPFEAIDSIPEGIIKIAWTGDVRDDVFDWQIELSKHVDIICSVSGVNNKQMSKHKKESCYFDIWYDDDIFHPTYNKDKDIDVVFMANNYSQFPLSGYRAEVVEFLKEKYGDGAWIFGNDWDGFDDGEMNSDHAKQNETYNSSKIAINISNFKHEYYSSDRILRAMGSGCFVLSHWYPKMPFKIHKHLEVFRNLEDLELKINYFLNNELRRNKIAKLGCKYVQSFGSKHQVKSRIEDIVKKYK